jgi:kinesin family protein 5
MGIVLRFLLQVVVLEIQLDEMKEQYSNVIRNSNNKAQQKKMAFLERNLEQLTLVQKQVIASSPILIKFIYRQSAQLVDQNSTLKKEAGIAERKLLARNERIQNLEALLQDADRRLSIQNQKFETQLQAVKERLEQARGKVFLFKECWCPNKTRTSSSAKGCRFIIIEFWSHC